MRYRQINNMGDISRDIGVVVDFIGQKEYRCSLEAIRDALNAKGFVTHIESFYTLDLPYLWGRLLGAGQIIFGSGLMHLNDWHELATLDISSGEAAELFARLERRVRGLHPALGSVKFTHRWGGPMLVAEEWQPVFAAHPRSPSVIVLGAFSGHGVALSVYLGRWAAEAMLGRRELPEW
jgi:glycine/D-amino acid oxidase-like deaminating enzyme